MKILVSKVVFKIFVYCVRNPHHRPGFRNTCTPMLSRLRPNIFGFRMHGAVPTTCLPTGNRPRFSLNFVFRATHLLKLDKPGINTPDWLGSNIGNVD